MLKRRWNKLGQVTIFIIIALVLVASVGVFFIVRDQLVKSEVPANLEPVYNSFLACIEEDTLVGINVLESQGGYIELPEFESGSSYMPFSSQLSFLGNPIPYWYYVSGNNIQKEQVPSLRDMEEQLENYIEQDIYDCILDSYLENGYGVSFGDSAKANVQINSDSVEVDLNMMLALERAEDSASVRNHNIVVNSKLGSLYADAREIYDHEQDTLFLENYGVDFLRLYAPVDGVELSCSPKIWNANEIFDELERAIEANTLALKVKGGDFDLQSEEKKYFVLDIPNVDNNVLFLNSRNWSSSYEVNPSEESVLIANPVGNQPGMSALGFCYVPYHFVYNVNYPVLVQVYSGQEIFQFPMAVVIQGNKPRESLDSSVFGTPVSELCSYKNTPIDVQVYDSSLNPVVANISFRCFGETCEMGTTSLDGSLRELFPQCVNGFVVARAEGYKTTSELVESSAIQTNTILIMDKTYDKTLNLKLDGVDYTGEAIITFVSEDSSDSVIYPSQKQVTLSEGQYEVQVYIYNEASIELEEQTSEECLEVPQEGIGGLFGITQEECYDITIPAQTINNALRGGGKQNYYILENELKSSSIIDINAESLDIPQTIEDLQENYIEFEDRGLDIVFK